MTSEQWIFSKLICPIRRYHKTRTHSNSRVYANGGGVGLGIQQSTTLYHNCRCGKQLIIVMPAGIENVFANKAIIKTWVQVRPR